MRSRDELLDTVKESRYKHILNLPRPRATSTFLLYVSVIGHHGKEDSGALHEAACLSPGPGLISLRVVMLCAKVQHRFALTPACAFADSRRSNNRTRSFDCMNELESAREDGEVEENSGSRRET
ncbi:hypothetical protein BDR04DRAFT_1139454 [Suillus decipiens]|nr:hypothetical protein BDR04DRAFT_1139454 [Suillus decipiens]